MLLLDNIELLKPWDYQLYYKQLSCKKNPLQSMHIELEGIAFQRVYICWVIVREDELAPCSARRIPIRDFHD
jgi:hypothetical protein